jgi:hypothetical protein
MTLILSGTDGLSDVDGSAATPAIRGTDANTGIFFPAADTIAFSEGGVESARIDSAGNFGLGVTPNTWRSNDKAIQVGGSTDYAAIVGAGAGVVYGNNFYRDSGGFKYKNSYTAGRFDFDYTASGGFSWNIAPSGTAGNTISFTQAMTLDASGNLGVGTTSPASFAGSGIKTVIGNAATTTTPAALSLYSGNATYGGLYFADGTIGDQLYRGYVEYKHDVDAMVIATAGTERMRITSIGAITPITQVASGGGFGETVSIDTFNNASLNTIGAANGRFSIVYISQGNALTVIPIFANAGGGVAWAASMLDPDAGTFAYGSGPSVSFATAGTGANSYTVALVGGTGSLTIQRTAGSAAYTVVVKGIGI